MKKVYVALIAAVLATSAISAASPAFALGGCGFNRHRNAHGYCVFGGQNQHYCLRRTGHYATPLRNGTFRCF